MLRRPLAAVVLVSSLTSGAVAAATAPPRPRLGLALSGGGARGFAHIGVLRALEACGLPIDVVAGTSMGAVVGGLYVAGYAPDELEEIASRPDWSDVFLGGDEPEAPLLRRREEAWALLRIEMDRHGLRSPRGLVPSQRLERLLSFLVLRATGSTGFARLHRPFAAVATDIETGAVVVLDRGSLTAALGASMAVPGVFSPVEIDHRLLVDGGLADNLPIDQARALGADVVIGVDVSSPLKSKAELTSFVEVLDQAISLRLVENTRLARATAELLVAPDIAHHTALSFTPAAARDLIRCGEEAGRAACAEAWRLLGGAPAAARPTARPARRTEVVHVRHLRIDGASERVARFARHTFGPLPEDGVLEIAELERRVARVQSAGCFERVGIELPAGAGDDGTLRLETVPSAPGSLSLAARFDDKVKALGRAALTWRRPLGPVRDAGLDVTFGDVVRAVLAARHDRLLGTPLLVALAAFHVREFDRYVVSGDDRGKLDIERDGFEATAGAAVGRGLFTLSYRLEDAASIAPAREPPLPARRRLAALVLRAELDGVGPRAYPRRGTTIGAALAVAAPWLGSESKHGLVAGELAHYRTPRTPLTLYLRARAAAGFAGALPVSEQPVAGGNADFPGYPRDAFRGDRLATAAAGLRLRFIDLPGALGGSAHVAAEAGAGTVDGGDPARSGHGRLRAGVAFGLGLDTRAGPFELLIGVNDHGRRQVTLAGGPRF